MDKKKLFLFVAFLYMFIILAIRSSLTGIDSVTQYPSVFRAATKLSFTELIKRWSLLQQMRLQPWTRAIAESGYVTLNWIIGNLLGLSYRTFLVFFSFFDAYCAYKYVERNSDAPLLGAMTVFRLLLISYCQAYRRMMSMGVFLLAFLQMEDKHYKRATVLMCLAFTIHRSSLIMFVLLYLSRIKITKEVLLRVGIFAFVTSFIPSSLVINFLTQGFAIFGKSGYLLEGEKVLASIRGGYAYRLLGPLYIAFLAFLYFFMDEEILQKPHNNLLCWIFLFYVAISPMESAFPIISQEIGFYFRPSIFIFLTNILVGRKENKYIKAALWTIFMVMFIYTQHRQILTFPYDGHGLQMEYRTIFQTRDGF